MLFDQSLDIRKDSFAASDNFSYAELIVDVDDDKNNNNNSNNKLINKNNNKVKNKEYRSLSDSPPYIKNNNSLSNSNNIDELNKSNIIDDENFDAEISEYVTYSLLIGLQDILSDIDSYILYFLLIDSIGCKFKSFYGVVNLSYCIVQLTWWSIIGIFVDFCDRTKTGILSILLSNII